MVSLERCGVGRSPRHGNSEPARLAVAGTRTGEALRVDEQEQDLLRCFRLLPDDQIRSEIIHFIRDFVP